MNESRFMSTADTAALLCVSETTLAKWRTAKKHLSYCKIGGLNKYERKDVEAFLEKSKRKVA